MDRTRQIRPDDTDLQPELKPSFTASIMHPTGEQFKQRRSDDVNENGRQSLTTPKHPTPLPRNG
jgi:hypothetical protein